MPARLFLLVLLACSSHAYAESFKRQLFAMPNSNSAFVKLQSNKRSFMEEIDVETGKTVRKTQYDRYPFVDYVDSISPDGKWYLIGLGMSYDGYRIPLLGGKQQRKRIFCRDDYLFSSRGKYIATNILIYHPPDFENSVVLPNPSGRDRLFFRADEKQVLIIRDWHQSGKPRKVQMEIFSLPDCKSLGVYELPPAHCEPMRWAENNILLRVLQPRAAGTDPRTYQFHECTISRDQKNKIDLKRRIFHQDVDSGRARLLVGENWYGIVLGDAPANSHRIWMQHAKTLPMTFSTYDYKTNQPRASITRHTMGRIFISPDGTKLAETIVNNPDEIILSSLDGTKRIAIPTKVITDEEEPTEQELKEDRDWLTREEEEPATIPSNPWPLIAGLVALALCSAFILIYYLRRRRQISQRSEPVE